MSLLGSMSLIWSQQIKNNTRFSFATEFPISKLKERLSSFSVLPETKLFFKSGSV